MTEAFYPIEKNLGKNCKFWFVGNVVGCDFWKTELVGRTSCEGMIDDVCLYIKDGREAISLSQAQRIELKTSPPDQYGGFHLPPGEII